MKKLIAAETALLFLLSVLSWAAVLDQKSAQHRASHYIVLKNEEERAGCSATAVALNVLLTAGHCHLVGATLYLDGDKTPHYIKAEVADDRDSLLIVLTDWPLHDWVPIVRPADYRDPVQGERVVFWGNPRGARNMFRQGIVSGVTRVPDDDIAPGNDVYLVAAPCQPGDSGSAIYSEDGHLLGVLTYGVFGGLFAGFYPIHFTEAQLVQAGL